MESISWKLKFAGIPHFAPTSLRRSGLDSSGSQGPTVAAETERRGSAGADMVSWC